MILKFLISLLPLLVVGSLVAFLFFRLFFKKSIFQLIGILWVMNIFINASLSKMLYTFPEQFPYWLALTLGLTNTVFFLYLTYKTVKNPLDKSIWNIQQLAEGKLGIKKLNTKKFQGELKVLGDATSILSTNLSNTFSGIKNSSSSINSMSQFMHTMAQKMTHGTGNQASSIQEVSASVEEMNANIIATYENAERTKKQTELTNTGLISSNLKASELLKAVESINNYVTIIDDIATETNLLALNASIEAKQAGEAGRGFNVVAAEVRKLAENSKKAAVHIQELTTQCRELSSDVSLQLESTLPNMEDTLDLMNEITTASMELKSGAEQVNNAIHEINFTTQENTDLSEELNNNAEKLNQESSELENGLSHFSIS